MSRHTTFDAGLARRKLVLGAVGVAAFAWSGAALAQDACEDYPSKPVELVTHAGAGGGTDVTTRMMALQARDILANDMPIVSKQGGAGVVAMNYVDSRPADGYTVASLTASHLGSVARGKAPFTVDQIVPVVRAAVDPQLLIVAEEGPYDTAQDLIDAMKEEQLKFAISLVGGVDHIATWAFAERGGLTQPTAVPFPGGGDIVTALVGQNVDVGVLNLSEAEAAIDAGDLRPLVALHSERMGPLPDVPTAHEFGIDAEFATIRGFWVKEGTPQCAVDILEEALLESMSSPVYQGFIESVGLDPSSPVGQEEWGAQIRKMYNDTAEGLKGIGILKE